MRPHGLKGLINPVIFSNRNIKPSSPAKDGKREKDGDSNQQVWIFGYLNARILLVDVPRDQGVFIAGPNLVLLDGAILILVVRLANSYLRAICLLCTLFL